MNKTEDLKKWVEDNFTKNPQCKIELTAGELFDLLSSVCADQRELDIQMLRREFEEILETGNHIRKLYKS